MPIRSVPLISTSRSIILAHRAKVNGVQAGPKSKRPGTCPGLLPMNDECLLEQVGTDGHVGRGALDQHVTRNGTGVTGQVEVDAVLVAQAVVVVVRGAVLVDKVAAAVELHAGGGIVL